MNAFQATNLGVHNAFVTKISANGSALVYSTFLGGSTDEQGFGIAVDGEGDAYITGLTLSDDFPTINAVQPAFHGGASDLFITKMSVDGRSLLYSTYFGGQDEDMALGIAVDRARSVYLTGMTRSADFPKSPFGLQPSFKRVQRGFLTKLAQQTFVMLSPTRLSFSSEVIGTPSVAKKVTVMNDGSTSLVINTPFFGGLDPADFAQTTTCGTTLGANASCTIFVTFTPATSGQKRAAMGISSSDPASPAAVFLFGTGTVLSLSTSKIGFGDQMISTTSAQLSVTLTNVGSTQLNFSGIDVIGTNSGDFSQTNNCGTSIAAKASCTIKATFQPSAIGKRTAFIRITDDGGGSPQKVSLTGTGT